MLAQLGVALGSSLIPKLFGGGKDKVEQKPMLTAEQKKAMENIYGIATGEQPSALGEAYTGGFGDYSLTGLEKQARGVLGERMGMGTALEQYKPLVSEIRRQGEKSSDVLRREQARTGSLYSTEGMESQQELQTDVQSQINQLLSGAYEKALSRQAGDIERGFRYGGLERELSQAEADVNYKNWLRQHNEELKQIDLLQNLSRTRVPYGAKEVPTKSGGTNLLNQTLGKIGSEAIENIEWGS